MFDMKQLKIIYPFMKKNTDLTFIYDLIKKYMP